MRPIHRAGVMIASGLVLGGVSAAAVSSRERSIAGVVGNPVAVLVTARTLEAGERIVPAVLTVRHVPLRWVPPAALANARQALGMVAAARLPAGSYLTPGAVRDRDSTGAGALGPGERVATVLAVSPPSSVIAGSRVDVLASTAAGRPRMVLSDVEVLAVRRSEDAGVGPGNTVEVDLRTDVAGALRLAGSTGTGAEVRLLPIGVGG